MSPKRSAVFSIGFFLAISFAWVAQGAEESPASRYPKRLTRAESFLGVQFVFHATPNDADIGKNTTRPMIEHIIEQVRPDYIEIDSKSHPGFSSYPTKVGNPAPAVVADSLRLWREVTAEHGVALSVHYSGVIDQEAVRKNPSWAALNAEGKYNPFWTPTSVFGPYVDTLMIPQFKELSNAYGLDGAWVDGDCWGAIPDYSQPALDAFRKETGQTVVPRKPSDPGYLEFMQFQREAFRRYFRHWVDAVHHENPRFQVASNWAFSTHMPEPVTANVDFLSGDVSFLDSVNGARFAGRCNATQGKPWELLAWAFVRDSQSLESWLNPQTLKSVVQLQREAAVTLALGGGFSAYFRQARDGSVFEWQMKLMAETARFCRARQAVCHRAKSVPQVALLYSGAAHYRQCPNLFSPKSPGVTALRGVLQCLLASQNAVEVCYEHNLAGRMADYPLIVVPDWDFLEPKFKEELVQYVRTGGNLLLLGPAIARLFEKELDVTFVGDPSSNGGRFLEGNGWLAWMKQNVQNVALGNAAEPFGHLYKTNTPTGPSEPAASIRSLGKGRIAAVYFNLGVQYLDEKRPVTRDFLQAVTRKLFPNPVVEVAGSHEVDVTLMRSHGKLTVNLVNTAGPHADTRVAVFDEIPAVGPLTVTLRLPQRPKSITLEPEHESLPLEIRGDAVQVVLPRLAIHEILVVE
jgi:hypothetical protein